MVKINIFELSLFFYVNRICFLGLQLRLQKALSEQLSYSTKRQTWPNEEEGFTIELNLKSKYCFLDLHLSSDLISKDYYEKYQTSETHFAIKRPQAQEIELCHYIGKIRNVENSWIAVTTCQGISGVIFDGQEIYTINDLPLENRTSVNWMEMIILNGNNATEMNFICGDNALHKSRKTREVERDLFNGSSYYVELALVVDNSLFKAMDSNVTLVHRRCKDIINLLNSIYQEFKIFVAIVCIDVWNHRNKVHISWNTKATFENFRIYAWSLLSDERVDNVQLLSHVKFSHKILGESELGGMCKSLRSFGINYDSMKNNIEEIAGILIHEMAHNIGIHHDDEQCECPDKHCVMWPSSSGSLKWSSCSYSAFKYILERTDFLYCLHNKPVSAFDTQSCEKYYTNPEATILLFRLYNILKWIPIASIFMCCCLLPLISYRREQNAAFVGQPFYPVYYQGHVGSGNAEQVVERSSQIETGCQSEQNGAEEDRQRMVEGEFTQSTASNSCPIEIHRTV